MSETSINVTITDEETLAFTLAEDTPISITIQGYSVAEGATQLDELADVEFANTPSTNDMLIHNGSKWVNDKVLKYIDEDNEFEIKLF